MRHRILGGAGLPEGTEPDGAQTEASRGAVGR